MDTVLIEYAVLPENLLIWVVDREGISSKEVPIAARDLERQHDRFRRAIASAAPQERLEELSAGLERWLIHPVRERLRDRAKLIVVPDRFLVGLPFGALLDTDSDRFLDEDYEVALVPSIAFLGSGSAQNAKSGRDRPPELTVVVGNPAIDRKRFPDLPALAGSETESRAVANSYPRTELLLGATATPDRLRSRLAESSVLHLATHTFTNGRGQVDLVLAPDGASLTDGLLDVEELDRRALSNLEVVYLSACNGAMPYRAGYRENLRGPVRAFLAARVPSVVGSLWGIEDASAAELARVFHHELAKGVSPSRALQTAKLHLLHHSNSDFRSLARWGAVELFISSWPTVFQEEETWRSTSR